MSEQTRAAQAAKAPRRSLAARLYLGEAGVNISDWRRRWLVIAGVLALASLVCILVRGFTFGIEFEGGNAFQVPASVGSLAEVEDAVADAGADVVSAQEVGSASGENTYLIRTLVLSSEEALAVKEQVAARFGLDPDQVGDDRVSAAWGGHVTRSALTALAVFVALVIAYLAIRFEARMAIAAVAGLLLDIIVSAGIYSAVGFEVTPATVIGFLTIMGFGLYDAVVVFDKVHENTRGITASNTQTYGEAANLAVNQTLIRSINTSIVALLPVGGLLFIGAGLLGAGTLKDLGLVLFVGMAVSFYTSLFVTAPLMVELKWREPRFRAHTQRVLAKRAALADREARKASEARKNGRETTDGEESPAQAPVATRLDPKLIELAGAAPKVGARPTQGRRAGGRKRPAKRR